jgi:hypothetical protein
MKYETNPVANEEIRIMNGRMPNFEINDKSAEYKA